MMTMKNDIEEAFSKLKDVEQQIINNKIDVFGEIKSLLSEIDNDLYWYYCIEQNQFRIIIESTYQSKCGKSFSTSTINVSEEVSNDGSLFYLNFDLLDFNEIKLFVTLISDLIEESNLFSNSKDAIKALLQRFNTWKKMLKHKNEKKNIIKGVIGELKAIEQLILINGASSEIIKSWTGPEHSQQDFLLPNFWIEAKTISSNSATVTINSLGQLDGPNSGFLYVVSLDSCDDLNVNAISFKTLYDKICKLLEDNSEALALFNEKIAIYEYDRFLLPLYDYKFKISNQQVYEVRDKFPRLLNEHGMIGIKTVKYELLLSVIDQWKIDEGCKLWII